MNVTTNTLQMAVEILATGTYDVKAPTANIVEAIKPAMTTDVDLVFCANDAIAHDGTLSIDLKSGNGEADPFGVALDFGKVNAIVIQNNADAAGESIYLTPAAANGLVAPLGDVSDKIQIAAGGGLLVLINPNAAGWTVDATHKILELVSNDDGDESGATAKVIILGQAA